MPDPDPTPLATAIANLSVWSRDGVRAPHKPLLLLYALARIQRGAARMVPYCDAEAAIQPLLDAVLPRRGSLVSYPFWNLQRDGIWQVEGAEHARRRGGNKEPVLADFRKPHVVGGLTAEHDQWLRAHPAALIDFARQLLEAHFQETQHDGLCTRLGLSVAEPQAAPAKVKRARDPVFRELVLRAYEFRCAVCGFDGRIDTTAVGLEAAHVRMHQAGGPDTLDNGMAMCAIHHTLFDAGVFSLTPGLNVAVSDLLNRSDETTLLVLRHHGQPLRGPLPGKSPVAEAHRNWHWVQVFKKPARAA